MPVFAHGSTALGSHQIEGTPDLIPGQVRLLRSLLGGREPSVDRVILASDTSGTFIPRPSPTLRR